MTGNIDLVDPELRPGLEFFALMPPLTPEGLPALRAAGRAVAPPFDDAGGKVLREERHIPGVADAPPVRVLVYRAAAAVAAPRPAVLHMHGGGYVMGVPEMSMPTHRDLVATTGCVVVSVDYRLAPETPFPGNIEDCYAALKWLHDEAGALGVDRERIGVMGESAGGGLAASLALLARDRGEIALAFQHLTYPMIDDRTVVTPDPHPHTGRYVWTPERNKAGWQALLGHPPGGPDVSPYAAAARETDLSGLPAAYIMTGALDLFLQEDMDYALRLTRAGVPVELHVYPGAYHGFQVAVGAAVVKQALRDSAEALARSLRG